ncbi:hypothetical protein BOSEA31B_14828 [Hyphomicrobiales bacterium]|nr:hypothetical protein BOSEA31B_14828 [Hyphomicrobiales bacterium]CAH1701318.1 hypothetical protein BOSEA1005_21017 [Hyphomicrobiales bacterium]CAI0345279.1 hypothetical protein BO1005MUT1_380074 [Hyphomicrobiales bacterium]
MSKRQADPASQQSREAFHRSDDFEGKKLAPGAGFEPATNRLTVDCSTAELSGNNVAAS